MKTIGDLPVVYKRGDMAITRHISTWGVASFSIYHLTPGSGQICDQRTWPTKEAALAEVKRLRKLANPNGV